MSTASLLNSLGHRWLSRGAASTALIVFSHTICWHMSAVWAMAQGLDKNPRIPAQVAAGDAFRKTILKAASLSDDQQRQNAFAEIRSKTAPKGNRGGGPQADFDALIELITQTIEPDSWDELGGPGAIQEFAGGVVVDASGFMKAIEKAPFDLEVALARDRHSQSISNDITDVRRSSELRKISLPRLEKAIQMRWAMGLPPTASMAYLAGVQRIEYIFVYPDTRDLVIAGPAGDWHRDRQNRAVSTESGVPVIQLDDLLVLLRSAFFMDGKFGCSITPRQDNLARTQSFINTSTQRPLKPSRRQRWLDDLREAVGVQDISVYGIEPTSRAAHVLVEADYHMKLIGMGLAHGVLGVESYLESIDVGRNQPPPSLGVLRWWFTLGAARIESNPKRDAFSINGQNVRLLSENELLAKTGKRIHTGRSEELNLQFADSFTRHFKALARQYPIYAELQNIFDLALVTALIKDQDLPSQVGWDMLLFGEPDLCPVAVGHPPKEVLSVINHRVINDKYVIAGVSGGVAVNASQFLQLQPIRDSTSSDVETEHIDSEFPTELSEFRWWWD